MEDSLGKQIREARKDLGLTQADLADLLKLSRQIVLRYEAGSDAPSIEILSRMAPLLQTQFQINGRLISVEGLPADARLDAKQLRLDFDKEHKYEQATIKIRPSRAGLVISAVIPA